MSQFDLGAYRAAKKDADPDKTVKIGKKTFKLPASMPLATVEMFGEGRIKDGLVALGGEDFADALYAGGINADELSAMMDELYGVSAGN